MKSLFSLLTHRTYMLTNRLLPTSCLLCGCDLKGELLCAGCALDLPHLEQAGQLCQQCSLPFASEGAFCGHCLHKPPAFSHSVIPFSYQYPLDFLIQSFKYRANLSAGRALAQVLAAQVYHHYQETHWPWPDLILPVPLHWTRRWQRGFNQAELIGQELAHRLNIPLQTRLCQRRQRTSSQKGLSRIERQKNLRNAFVIAPKAQEKLQRKCVALLDDVVTTTATARTISDLLIGGGASEVHVWALARTLDYNEVTKP